MKSFQKYRKVIYVIITFIIIALVIMLPIYFFVIKKSSSSEPITIGPDTLGFCSAMMVNNIKQPNKFIVGNDFNTLMTTMADNGETFILGKDPKTDYIQYKWFYDKTNPLHITRSIPNTNNNYSDEELKNLGTPISGKPGEYLVNQFRLIYDETNLKYKTGSWIIPPSNYTTYSQCMKNL